MKFLNIHGRPTIPQRPGESQVSHGRTARKTGLVQAAKLGVSVMMCCVGMHAIAGKFSCHNWGSVGCTSTVSDLITEKFAQRYPWQEYEIVVISSVDSPAKGIDVAFAIAGVMPLKVGVVGQQFSYVPVHRYISTFYETSPSPSGPADKHALEIDAVRDAIRQLMTACDRSPNCDVMEK